MDSENDPKWDIQLWGGGKPEHATNFSVYLRLILK